MINKHIPVLLNESLEALKIKTDGCYFDGTFGRGGHSRAILKVLDKNGKLYATDRDILAAKEAKNINDERFFFSHGLFSSLNSCFPNLGNESLDGVLLDLGVSSPQLDDADRGFSFTRDGLLDMRMDPSSGITAKDFVNKADVEEMVVVISLMGEERFAKRIAHNIVKEREIEPINTTKHLADIVKNAIPAKFHTPGRHPATRTFQAIRIFVNKELDELQNVLKVIYPMLKHGGRLVVISFHSLEDDCIRKFVKKLSGHDIPPELPVTDSALFKKVKLIGRPVRPNDKEIADNPRSRSSLMRIVEKL